MVHRGRSANVYCMVCRCRHAPGSCNEQCVNCGLRHNGGRARSCHNCGSPAHRLDNCPQRPRRPPPRLIVEEKNLEPAGLYNYDASSGTWTQVGRSAHHATLWNLPADRTRPHSPTSEGESGPPPPPPTFQPPTSFRPVSLVSAGPFNNPVEVSRRRFVTEVTTVTKVTETTREVPFEDRVEEEERRAPSHVRDVKPVVAKIERDMTPVLRRPERVVTPDMRYPERDSTVSRRTGAEDLFPFRAGSQRVSQNGRGDLGLVVRGRGRGFGFRGCGDGHGGGRGGGDRGGGRGGGCGGDRGRGRLVGRPTVPPRARPQAGPDSAPDVKEWAGYDAVADDQRLYAQIDQDAVREKISRDHSEN